MWWKLLLNKWVIGGLAVAGIAGATYLYGRDAGFASGFDKAHERYRINMESIYDAWESSIDDRDSEWQDVISLQINKLQESIDQLERDKKREQELLGRLSVIETRFRDVDNEISQASDLGSCNLTDGFDGLLDRMSAPSRDQNNE